MQYPRGRAEDLEEHSLLDLRERFRLEPLYQRNAGIDMECTSCGLGGSWFLELVGLGCVSRYSISPSIPSPVDL
jgi:hypothetical protein